MSNQNKAQIAIIGGTGLYALLDESQSISIDTPFGSPSAAITLGKLDGKDVAFLPRHGTKHSLPPHKINYRANIWALKSLGVKFIIAPCAAGSLQEEIKPGDFVVCDQFIDRTRLRQDTFYDEAPVTHISTAQPFCNYLRGLALSALEADKLSYYQDGTLVVIQGPRFSTAAESRWFTSMGWHVINMTVYPEAVLAMEQEMSYVNIALITDYDSGLSGKFAHVNAQDAVAMFTTNTAKLKQIIFNIIDAIDLDSVTSTHSALARARF